MNQTFPLDAFSYTPTQSEYGIMFHVLGANFCLLHAEFWQRRTATCSELESEGFMSFLRSVSLLINTATVSSTYFSALRTLRARQLQQITTERNADAAQRGGAFCPPRYSTEREADMSNGSSYNTYICFPEVHSQGSSSRT